MLEDLIFGFFRGLGTVIAWIFWAFIGDIVLWMWDTLRGKPRRPAHRHR